MSWSSPCARSRWSAKPVIRTMVSPGWVAATLSASAMPSITGILMSERSRANRPSSATTISEAMPPSGASITSCPACISARDTNARTWSSSSARRMRAILLPFECGRDGPSWTGLAVAKCQSHPRGPFGWCVELGLEIDDLAALEIMRLGRGAPFVERRSRLIEQRHHDGRNHDAARGDIVDAGIDLHDLGAVAQRDERGDVAELEPDEVDAQPDRLVDAGKIGKLPHDIGAEHGAAHEQERQCREAGDPETASHPRQRQAADGRGLALAKILLALLVVGAVRPLVGA